MENNKKTLKQYLILIAALLVVINVLGQTMTRPLPAEVFDRCPVPHSGEVITQQEFSDFLETWPKYVNESLKSGVTEDLSLLSDKPSQKLPWRLQYWLRRHCWETDRFFYVQQRLHQIINTSYLQFHTQGVISALKEMKRHTSDAAKIEAFEQMIEQHRQMFNVEKISQEELDLVREKEAQVLEIISVSK